MKKIFFLFAIVFIILSSFVVSAETFKGDGSYKVNKNGGDIIIANNGYQIQVIGAYAPYVVWWYNLSLLDASGNLLYKFAHGVYDEVVLHSISKDEGEPILQIRTTAPDSASGAVITVQSPVDGGGAIPSETITEFVKCVFSGTENENKCYSVDEKYRCTGVGTCIVEVKEIYNKKIEWKSSCGGYATTTTDGNNDYAEFSCVSDEEKACVDYNNMDSCLDNTACSWDQETSSCTSFKLRNSCSDPDGGNNIFEKAHTFGYRSSYADSRDKRIRTGGLDSCLSDTQLLEHFCDNDGFIQTTSTSCFSQCNDGACVAEKISEKVTCNFKESAGHQECHSAGAFNGQEYSCTTDGNDVVEGVYSCSMIVSNYKGQKIEWKSSCGGYQSTQVDGNDEFIGFACSSPTEGGGSIYIQETWFKNSYWQCYDGTGGGFEESEESSSCKPSEFWQTYAKESCENHCSSDGSKCGVNSFSVSNYCYPETSPQQPTSSSSTSAGESLCDDYAKDCKSGYESACFKWKDNCYSIEGTQKTDKKEEILICRDSCPLNGKCYPFGYRKSSNFCSDNGGFIKQLSAGEKCENNFECGSNVCASNQCVSQGFLDKVFAWFKGIFGGE